MRFSKVRKVFAAGFVAAAALASASASGAIYDSAIVHYQFDSIAGGVVTDSGSAGINLNVNNGTGSTSLVPGPAPSFGTAINLADEDDAADSDGGAFLTATSGADTALNLMSNSAVSMGAWVQRAGTGHGLYLASKSQSSGDFRGWTFHVTRSGQIEIIFRYQNTTAERIIATSSTAIADTDWHHIGFSYSYDGGDPAKGLDVYIDGSPVAVTIAGTGFATPRDLSVTNVFTMSGRNGGQVDEGGLIDDFAVWNSVLTPSDFQTLAAIPEPSGLCGLLLFVSLASRRREKSR